MSRTRASGRTTNCGRAEATQRLQDARAHLDLAELSDAGSLSSERKAAASAAVNAGIAAADAACCSALGMHSASQDHADAIGLVSQISPGGTAASNKLRRLLALKHAAQYGLDHMSGQGPVDAQKWARGMVEFADEVLRR